MQRWLLVVGFALSACFIGYVFYSSVIDVVDEPSPANIFTALGMLGLLFILAATMSRRARS